MGTAAALLLISVARLHSFFPPVAALRPALVIAPLALVALLLNHSGPRHLRHLRGPLGYAMLFVFVWATIGAPFSIYKGNSVRYLLEEFFRTGIIVLVLAAAVRNSADLIRLLKVYAMGAILFSVLGQGQGGYRAFGGGGYDPNDAAMFIVSAIPLVLYFVVRAKRLAERLLFGFGLLSCGSVVVLSGSRGGFIALVAVVLFVLVAFGTIRRWVRLAVVGVLVGAIIMSATGDFWDRIESTWDPEDYNRHSDGGRIEVWKRGLSYMRQSPIAGVGINNFSVAEGLHPLIVGMIAEGRGMKYSAAHSTWIQVAAELGVPGIVCFVLMFLLAFRLLWAPDRGVSDPRVRGSPDVLLMRELGRPLMAVFVGMLVAGSFLSSAYSSMLWAPLAFTLGVSKLVLFERQRVPVRGASGIRRGRARGGHAYTRNAST